MSNNHHEAITEPIYRRPEHPQAIPLDGIKQKVADAAIERVSGYDINPTEHVPVQDQSAGEVNVPVKPRAYTFEEQQQLHGSEIRAAIQSRPTPEWMKRRDGKIEKA